MYDVIYDSLSEPIAVAGFQIRTSNARELSGTGHIANLWQRFFSENLGERIVHRLDDNLYVVYSNYASDEYGDYDYLLGMAVSSIDSLPPGATYAAIPSGEYSVIMTEQGSVASVVQDAWKYIWNMPAEELGGRRSFIADYEIYDSRAKDPNEAQVEIHLGIQPEIPLSA